MTELLHNQAFILPCMAVIIFALTQGLKFPYKKFFTSKIKDERKRHIANIVILLIPFALGVLGDYLYSTYYLLEAFDIVRGLGYGTASISLYGIINQFLVSKISNPYEETEEGKADVKAVDNIKDKQSAKE